MTTFPLYRINLQNLVLSSFLFLFFFTLPADMLNLPVLFFKCKVNHLLAIALFIISLPLITHYRVPKALLISFFFFTTSLLISTFYSILPQRCLGYVLVFCFQYICYFLIPMQIILHWDHQRIFSLYWLSFIFVGLHAFMQLFLSLFGIIDPFVGQFLGPFARPHAMAYEPSYYALYMCLFVMYYNAKALLDKSSIFRVKKLLSLIAVNVLLVLSTSTGVFFAYFIFILVSFFFSYFSVIKPYALALRKKLFQFTALIAVIFGLVAVSFPHVFTSTFLKFFVGVAFKHGSIMTRWKGITDCWDIFLQYPLFGVGLGGVAPYIHQQEDLLGASLKDSSLDYYWMYDPTNVGSEILASLGLFGVFAFLFLGAIFYQTFKKAVKTPSISSAERNEVISLFISLVVGLCVLQFNQNIFRSYIWVHSALSFGLFYKFAHFSKKETYLVNTSKNF